MTTHATVTGTLHRNTGPGTPVVPWPSALVVATPILLDESASLADSRSQVRVRTDDTGAALLHLWPGAWRITLPDGEVIDGPDHTGVVVEDGGVYTLEALRGYVPGPGVSVSTMALPTPTAAGQALTLDDDLQPQWQPLGDIAGAVESVNGQTGAVVLDAADVGADPAGAAAAAVAAHAGEADPHPTYTTAAEAAAAAPVQSVAGRTGDVTLSSGDVTDWAEAVQDAVAAMLVSGANVTLSYDDAAGKVTVTAAGGDAEVMRDTIGAALVGAGGIAVAVNDAADTITLSISGLTAAQVAGLATVATTGAYGDLTGKPTSMTPTAHAASHASGGSDALTPADIGAAAASHTHTPAQIGTGTPAAGTYVDGGTGAWTALPASNPTLLATYVHSSNMVIKPTAVDISSGYFTCANHGLSTGQRVVPHLDLMNLDFLPLYIPTGIPLNTPSQTVTVIDPNTFMLTGITSFTANPTMDLSKWHFETTPVSMQVYINNFGVRQRAEVRIFGRGSCRYVEPLNVPDANTWLGPVDTYGSTNLLGWGYGYSTCLIDTRALLTFVLNKRCHSWSSTTAFTNDVVAQQIMYDRLGPIGYSFSGIVLQNGHLANGTTVEVWSA